MSALDFFWAAPPLSRTIAAAAFTSSVLVYSGFISGYHFYFALPFLWKFPPQLWRLGSSFLLTGPKLGILFDTYFLYMYGTKLERSSPKFSRAGDFFTYTVFVALVVIFLNVIYAGGAVFTSALLLAWAYTSSQDDRGQKATFFFVSIPAELVPYAMLLVTLLMEGPYSAKIQATGLVAAHLHDFLTRLWPTFGGGRNLLPTPAFVTRMWQTTEAATAHRGFGTAFTPAQRTASTTGSSAGGVLPESWRSRGSGHRLGGE